MLSSLKDRRLYINLRLSNTESYCGQQRFPSFKKHFFIFQNLFCFKYDDKVLVPKIYAVYSTNTAPSNQQKMCLSKHTLHNSKVKLFQFQTNIFTKIYNTHLWSNMLISPGQFSQLDFLYSSQTIDVSGKCPRNEQMNKRQILWPIKG